MEGHHYQSWGRYSKTRQVGVRPLWRDEVATARPAGKTALPFGNGRSYGDVCLNDAGILLDCRGLDRFIAFDPRTGLLRCESGVLLSEIHQLTVEQGWFLPVTPGTQAVTLGGAIANDIHGKNHHRAGTFGRHVASFEILRSDGTRLRCSPDQNADWFKATIGGLGLTGLITWAEIRLRPIITPFIDQESIRFRDLDEFFALSEASEGPFEYTVAWVDCLARGKSLGRGLFLRGNHAGRPRRQLPRRSGPRWSVPIDLPFAVVNPVSLRLFNSLYYRRQLAKHKCSQVHFAPFFYPLDRIAHWNRLYGTRGFLQYQCVIPPGCARPAIREILERIAASKTGSFLSVLKVFGCAERAGVLSFARPGATLALDFPNRGEKTLALLEDLDEVTRAAGGAVNPAKDGRMSAESFQTYFPQWREMLAYRDPQISSNFWRRVTETREPARRSGA